MKSVSCLITRGLLTSDCILRRTSGDLVYCRSSYTFGRTSLQWTLRWSRRRCQDRFWNIINHTSGFGRVKRSTRTICRRKSWWTLWKGCKFVKILTDYKWKIHLLSKLGFKLSLNYITKVNTAYSKLITVSLKFEGKYQKPKITNQN